MRRYILLLLTVLLLTGCGNTNVDDVSNIIGQPNDVVVLTPQKNNTKSVDESISESIEDEVVTKPVDESISEATKEQNVQEETNIESTTIDAEETAEDTTQGLTASELELLYDKLFTIGESDKLILTQTHSDSGSIEFYVDVENDYAACVISDNLTDSPDAYIYNEGKSYVYLANYEMWSATEGIRFEDILYNGTTVYGSSYYFNSPLVDNVKDMQHNILTSVWGINEYVDIPRDRFIITNAVYTEQAGIDGKVLEIQYHSIDGLTDSIMRIDELTEELVYLCIYSYESDTSMELIMHDCPHIYDPHENTISDFETMLLTFKEKLWFIENTRRKVEYSIIRDKKAEITANQ